MTYITNDVLTSRQVCVCDLLHIDLHLPKGPANCNLFTHSCLEQTLCDYYPGATFNCTKQTHREIKEHHCPCKLCVKEGPACLKSLCGDKISEFTFYPIPLRKRNYCKRVNILFLKFTGF